MRSVVQNNGFAFENEMSNLCINYGQLSKEV